MRYNEVECLFLFWIGYPMDFAVLAVIFGVTGEEVLYGYGPLGVATVALAVIGYRMFNIILTDRDKAIAQRDSLLEDFFTKVLPAITKNTEVLEQRQDLDKEFIHVIKEVTDTTSANKRTIEEIKLILTLGGTAKTGGT